MDIALNAFFFAAHDEGNLRMCLQAHDPINDVTAGLFQLGRHVDIIFFIKPGLDFHEYRDLFAIFGSLGQGSNNWRFAAHAVQGLLDGQHIRVRCGKADEFFNGFKGFIGMMDHDILLGNGLPHVGGMKLFQFPRRLGERWRIAQVVVPFDAGKGEKYLAVQWSGNHIHIAFFQSQLRHEQGLHHAAGRNGQFQPDSGTFFPFFQ